MLSGNNGILKRAGDARHDTTVAQEKEQVELAYVSAAVKNLGGNVTGQNLQDELDVSIGENKTTVTGTSTLKVKFEDTQNEYKVSQDGKVEKKNSNPNVLDESELYENGSTYFGYDVINYAETLASNLQDTKWQLFYAGPLDIDTSTATILSLTEAERTEERIWLISKEYVKNTVLPAKNGDSPIPVTRSEYKAKFGTNTSDGIMPQYIGGSSLITQAKLKALNSDFFKDYTSTEANMRAVAYMMDTTSWSTFATSTQNYAELAIGGPTVELLFTAYNKYKGTTYESNAVSDDGYGVRKKSSDTFEYLISSAIADDVTTGTNKVDSPYSVSSITGQARGYWLASPSCRMEHCIMCVRQNGDINFSFYDCLGRNPWYEIENGFRPLILLNSNYTLEKTKDTNGNDAFKIVEK